MRKSDNKTQKDENEAIIPPRTLADIPKLGPVRVRALVKAGLTTPSEVKAMPISELAKINGMSEIKAQQTLEFLAQFSDFTGEAPVSRSNGGLLPSSALPAEAVLGLRRLVSLLIQVPAGEMRGRLVREIDRFAEAVLTVSRTLPQTPETLEAVLFVIRDITHQLEAALALPKLGKKAQADLAEVLLTASVKLLPDVVV